MNVPITMEGVINFVLTLMTASTVVAGKVTVLLQRTNTVKVSINSDL